MNWQAWHAGERWKDIIEKVSLNERVRKLWEEFNSMTHGVTKFVWVRACARTWS